MSKHRHAENSTTFLFLVGFMCKGKQLAIKMIYARSVINPSQNILPLEEYLWCLSAISWWLPTGEDTFGRSWFIPQLRNLRKHLAPSPTVEVGPKMHHSALRHLINTVPCFTWVFPFIQTHMCVCRSLPWFLFCCSNWGRKKIQAWLMLCWTACQTSGLTRYPAPLFSTFLLYYEDLTGQ